jgi:hypothetical protein
VTTAQVKIHEVGAGEHGVIVTARCLIGIVRVGTRFQRADRAVGDVLVDLVVTGLRRYPGVRVEAIEPPHAARVTLTGMGGGLIRPGDVIT